MRTIGFSRAFLMAVLGSVLCGPAVAEAAIKVACVGDSITLGRRATTPQKTYPALLGARLGAAYEVGNFGIGGATALKRGSTPYWTTTGFPASDAFMPNIVVMMFGSNDSNSSSWAYKADFDADYKALVAHYLALPTHPKVYIALPPPAYEQGNVGVRPQILNNEVIPAIKKVAADTGTPVIDVYTALSGVPQDFIDLVHPNDDGNLKIANAVYAALTMMAAPDGGIDAGAADTGGGSGGAGGGGGGAGGATTDAGGGSGGAGGARPASDAATTDAGAGDAAKPPPGTGGAAGAGAGGHAGTSGGSGSSGGCAIAGGGAACCEGGLLLMLVLALRGRRPIPGRN